MRLLRKRDAGSDGDALFFAARSAAKPATSSAAKPATVFAQSITLYYHRIASLCLAEANCSSRRVECFSFSTVLEELCNRHVQYGVHIDFTAVRHDRTTTLGQGKQSSDSYNNNINSNNINSNSDSKATTSTCHR